MNLLLVALITSLAIAALTLLGRCPIPRDLLLVLAALASVYVLALLIQFSSDFDAALRSYADPAGPLGRVYPVPFDVPVARAHGLALPAAILACATCVMLLVLPVVLAAPGASARKTPASESPWSWSVLALLTGGLVIVSSSSLGQEIECAFARRVIHLGFENILKIFPYFKIISKQMYFVTFPPHFIKR